MQRLRWLGYLIVGLLLVVLGGPPLALGQEGGQAVIGLVEASHVVGLRQWGAHGFGVYALAWAPPNAVWTPQDRVLASGGYEGRVTLWATETGDSLLTIVPDGLSTVNGLVWSPDGTRLLGGLHQAAVRLWDAASGERLVTLDPDGQIVYGVSWSPDGTRLVAAAFDGTVFVWQAADPDRPPRKLTAHDWIASAVAFSPDGTRLASAGYDNQVKVWDGTTWAAVLTLPAAAWVQTVTWSPDGSQIVAGCWDGTILLWDAADGRLLFRLAGHAPGEPGGTLGVSGLAFSPDGRVLASVAGDGSLRLWDPASGQELVALGGQTTGPDRGLHSVAWSPDGTLLATGAEDGSVRLWGLPVLRPGWQAQVHVLLDDRLNVRSEPRIDTNLLARLEDGARVTVLDGPVEADGYTWWQVETADGVAGWVVESADYLLTLRLVVPVTIYPEGDPASGEEFVFPTPTQPFLPTPTEG